jgi:uncharacterized RDD family membrane protein YckC
MGRRRQKRIPMATTQYVISSATGVDVSLNIAGTGSRAYAFLIDWHIRLLLAVAWFVCADLLIRGTLRFGAGTPKQSELFYFAAVLPTVILYFLYHPILEVLLRGRTPGKRTAGLCIVTRSGGTPGAGALLIRNVFRLIDQLPLFYLLGLAFTAVTKQRVRLGDLAAGTLLVFDGAQAQRSLAQLGSLSQSSIHDPALLDIVNDLLERWADLDDRHRMSLARTLLARITPGIAASELLDLSSAELRLRLDSQLRGEAVPT